MTGQQITHPAKFNDAILDTIRDVLVKEGVQGSVLDPFAGTGRIHLLELPGVRTIGVEIEREWAGQHWWTMWGDSRYLSQMFIAGQFAAIVTSPAYGNRMADSYAGDAKGSRRHTYRIALGRDLTEGNGAGMQWGEQYRRLHFTVWRECHKVLGDDGLIVVNVKNHVRAGQVVDVVGWHERVLRAIGFDMGERVLIEARGVRHGANHDARVDHEVLLVGRKRADQSVDRAGRNK